MKNKRKIQLQQKKIGSSHDDYQEKITDVMSNYGGAPISANTITPKNQKVNEKAPVP